MSELSLSGRLPEPAAFASLLEAMEKDPVQILSIRPVAGDRGSGELKHMGYGVPLLVSYRVREEDKRVVFRTQSPNWFGHDRRADRADLTLLAADTFREQPRHVQVLDVGALAPDGFRSLWGAGELYLVTTYADGELYAKDLRQVEQVGVASELDLSRVRALAEHLAGLHQAPLPARDAHHYERAWRDLIGSGEGMFGISDSYPTPCEIPAATLERIEHLAVSWRWRLKSRGSARVVRTHGDFHPYNVLFRAGADFTLLDASRGGKGEAADDLAAMSINFLFGGLRAPSAWARGFGPLWQTFFATYFAARPDAELCRVFPPFFAWRALVLASPVWYPDVPSEVRQALLAGVTHLLEHDDFEPESIEHVFSGLR